MMKILLITIYILILTCPVFAQKSEWIDSSYAFTKVKRIYVSYVVAPQLQDGIINKKTPEWFFSQIKKELVDKLSEEYQIDSQFKVAGNILAKTGVSLENRYKKSPEEASKFFKKYLQDNYDVVIEGTFLEYTTGKKHHDGYTYTTSVPKTTTAVGLDGQFSMVTTTESQIHSIPSSENPYASITMRIDVTDTKTLQNVWSIIDKREKEDGWLGKEVNPKGMYNRIITDFTKNFRRVLSENFGESTKKEVGF